MCSKYNHKDTIHQAHIRCTKHFFIPLTICHIHTLQSVLNTTTETPYIRFTKGQVKDARMRHQLYKMKSKTSSWRRLLASWFRVSVILLFPSFTCQLRKDVFPSSYAQDKRAWSNVVAIYCSDEIPCPKIDWCPHPDIRNLAPLP